MRRCPFSRPLLAAALALALVLSSPAPAAFAAPVETPVLTQLGDWLASWFQLQPAPARPSRHGDAQEAPPTLGPDGLSEAPSPTLTSSQTGDDEGEGLPTVDPNG